MNYDIGFMLVFIMAMLADVVRLWRIFSGTRSKLILYFMQTFIKFVGAISGFI